MDIGDRQKMAITPFAKQGFELKRLLFTFKKRNIVVETICLLYILLFLYTGVIKLVDYDLFKDEIAQSPILKPMASLISWMVPIGEFGIGLLLVLPRYRLTGLMLALILMILFTAYIFVLLFSSEGITCSCGGVIEMFSLKAHIVFNSVFIMLALVGIYMKTNQK